MVSKLASAIFNDVVSGLVGLTSPPTISMEQLEQDVIDERLQIIKEYSLKNLIPKNDLYSAIRCITPIKKSLDQCPVSTNTNMTWSFEVPQILSGFSNSIDYIGYSNMKQEFKVYTDITAANKHKYKRRGCDDPFVYISTTPNCNNMYDAWVFNLPTAKSLTFIGIVKDVRQLANYACCADEDLENYTFISTEIKKRLTEKKLRYYRQLYHLPPPNDQIAK